MINLKDRDYFLFDGAFGTYYSLLYGDNEPCELANLDKSERVLDIHRQYIDAGADAIKTNTFAANSFSLSCGRETVDKIIEAGFKNALDAANGRAEVFADIGPVPATEEESFEEHIKIADKFISLGAKNFLLETMSGIFVLEIVSHIKKRVPDAFVIISFAAGQDGYTIDGENASDIAEAASKSKADAIGFNCICGPAHLLGILKRLPKTEKMISIMPNSGYPSVADGKAVYSDNPKYFAQKLAQIHAAGAKILGGCCGTTPEHIKETKKLLERYEFSIPVIRANPVELTSAAENAFKEKLLSGEKVVAVELDPPLDADFSHIAEAAPYLKDVGADAITLADSPLARPRADSVIISAKVQRETGIQTIPHLTCRDHNTIGLKSILLGGSIEGIRNVLIVTGDPVPAIERSEVKGVFSTNSYNLIKYVNSLNEDVFKGKEFFVGGALNVNVQNFKSELARAVKKEENGAKFFLTQPVYSDEAIENIRLAKETLVGKILAGIMPIASYKNALFLNNEVSGIHIPDEIIKRMEGKSPDEVKEISLEFSFELIEKLSFADGYYIITPLKKYQLAGELVKKIKRMDF